MNPSARSGLLPAVLLALAADCARLAASQPCPFTPGEDLTSPNVRPPHQTRVESVAVVDLDGKNGPDLIGPNDDNSSTPGDTDEIGVLFNLGDGTFQAAISYPAGDWPYSLAVGDFDGRNGIDVAVANRNSGDVSILFNNGDATFAPQVRYPVGMAPECLRVADLDGVNGPDLVVANYLSSDLSVL